MVEAKAEVKIEEKHQNTKILINMKGKCDRVHEVKICRLVKVMAIGLSGSGKSSIMNAVLNSTQFDSTSSGIPSISNLFKPVSSTVSIEGVTYTIEFCDTRGLGDPKVSDADIFRSIQELYCSDFNSVNKVLICLRHDRMRADMSINLSNLTNYLMEAGFSKHQLILCITHLDSLKDTQVEAFIEEMFDHPIVGTLFKMSGTIMRTVLPNLDELDEDDRDIYTRYRLKTVSTLLDTILEPCEPLKIMTQEKFLQLVNQEAKIKVVEFEEEKKKWEVEYKTKMDVMDKKLKDFEDARSELMRLKQVKVKNEELQKMILDKEKQKEQLKTEINSLKDQVDKKVCQIM